MQKIPWAADELGTERATSRKSHQLLMQIWQGKLTALYFLWVTLLRARIFFVLNFFSVKMIPE